MFSHFILASIIYASLCNFVRLESKNKIFAFQPHFNYEIFYRYSLF